MERTALNETIANHWMDAFNEHDLEKLLSLYAENARHFSPKLKTRQPATNGWIEGKPTLRTWWADAFDRLPTLQYHLKNLIVNDQQVLMEYERTVEHEPPMMVAEILEIENGLIVKSRLYHG